MTFAELPAPKRKMQNDSERVATIRLNEASIDTYAGVKPDLLKGSFRNSALMLNNFNRNCPVYIACGYTDLRRGIDGLASMVSTQFQMDSLQMLLFCGRKRSRIKALYREEGGFLLLYKRLELAKPVLDALLVRTNETAPKIVLKSALGKALHYLLEQCLI